jgi:hypothetical protein
VQLADSLRPSIIPGPRPYYQVRCVWVCVGVGVGGGGWVRVRVRVQVLLCVCALHRCEWEAPRPAAVHTHACS